MKPIFHLLCLLFSLMACTNDQAPAAHRPGTAEQTHLDYQVWGAEGQDEVTIRLQYRRGDAEGEAFAVEKPGQVLLDGEPLPVDSTQFAGAFYEVIKPAEAFKGPHTITFIDQQKKEHREEFSFEPFGLAEELPETIRMKPFQIRLDGIPESATLIRVVITDTSMESSDVNEELMVENGVVEITADHLSRLIAGPVTIELYREEEKPVRQDARNRGKLMVIYALKREINLVR